MHMRCAEKETPAMGASLDLKGGVFAFFFGCLLEYL